MFGIIAGVLVGVWAIYTMLGGEVNERVAVSQIQMLREAAVQFKNAPGNDSSYLSLTLVSNPLVALRPYLGRTGLAKGRNVFGSNIFFDIHPPYSGNNLAIEYHGVPDSDRLRDYSQQFWEGYR